MIKNYLYLICILGFLITIGFLMFQMVVKNNENTPIVNSKKIKVVTSIYPLYFFSQKIAGVKAEITNITPANTEPHDYDLTSRDIANIENSSLLIINGGGLEVWADRIKKNINGSHTKIVTAGEGVINIQDPHVWLSPPLAEHEVRAILNGFITTDPINKKYYEKNANALIKKLKKLDQEYSESLSSCDKNEFVTSHSAFGYLANTYGLTQISIAGISPENEPSSKHLAEIADFANKHKIEYIFFESLISPKFSQTIAKEIGAKTLVLDPIEGISNDDMKKGVDYFSIMQQNLTNLKIALECK